MLASSALELWQGFHVQIYADLADATADRQPCVVVIGNFDGVHLGHQQVIAAAVAEADSAGISKIVAVTFDPHPMAVLSPAHAPVRLTSIPERAALLADLGVTQVLPLAFDAEMATWSPVEFVKTVLVDAMAAVVVVVGANFRFGHKASGDITTLTQLGDRLGFHAVGVQLVGGPQVWSSTYIRTCLAAGDVVAAAIALGRDYAVRGLVEKGAQRGRELGFPTANVATDSMLPADGVYAGWVQVASTRYPAAISVGTNPTFGAENQRTLEAYVLDRDDLNLYGVEVSVSFLHRIRPMLKFSELAELISAMQNDVETARGLLGLV